MPCSAREKVLSNCMRESDKRRVGGKRIRVREIERGRVEYRNVASSSMAGLENCRLGCLFHVIVLVDAHAEMTETLR